MIVWKKNAFHVAALIVCLSGCVGSQTNNSTTNNATTREACSYDKLKSENEIATLENEYEKERAAGNIVAIFELFNNRLNNKQFLCTITRKHEFDLRKKQVYIFAEIYSGMHLSNLVWWKKVSESPEFFKLRKLNGQDYLKILEYQRAQQDMLEELKGYAEKAQKQYLSFLRVRYSDDHEILIDGLVDVSWKLRDMNIGTPSSASIDYFEEALVLARKASGESSLRVGKMAWDDIRTASPILSTQLEYWERRLSEAEKIFRKYRSTNEQTYQEILDKRKKFQEIKLRLTHLIK